jgi:DNA-binding response OmpR family regulator
VSGRNAEPEILLETVMFKNQDDQIAILGVCVDEPEMFGRTEGLNFCSVRSGRRAIDMLRMLSFDLVVTGMRLPDIDTWDFIRRIRAGWSWQKWALIGNDITEQQEITARMFGSLKIFETMPSSDELINMTSAVREKAAMAVLHRNYGHQKFANIRPLKSVAAM